MTDETTKTPPTTDSNGAASPSAAPFGGFTIDFSGDTGAVPLAAAVTPIAFGPDAGAPVAAVGGPEGAVDGRGPTESKVVIVGSGPAGLTAAIYAARANLAPIVLAGSAAGGQLMITSDVENYPGFPGGDPGSGPDGPLPRAGRAVRHAHRRRGRRAGGLLSGRPFRLWARGVEYRAESVIVATGASAIWLGLESETRLRGRGVSACATCDGFFFRDKEIAVVGGGDTALEEATFLTRFASKVHLLHRRDEFRGSKIMVERAARHPKIEIHTNTAVEEVLGETHVEALRLRDTATGEERTMAADGLFVAIGHKPDSEVFRDWLDVDEKGYLIVRDHTATKIDGVFVAGDVHDHRYRQAVTAAGDGCRAAIDAERWLESEGIAQASTKTAW